MSDSLPELNPYASPAEVEFAATEPLSDFMPTPAVRPRWWEILIFAVLLLGYLPYSIYSLVGLFNVFGPSNSQMAWYIATSLVRGTLTMVTFVGGIIALRLWWWRMVPGGLAPGHLVLLTRILSLTYYMVVMLVSGVLAVALGGDLTSAFMTFQILTPLVPLALLLWMLPRYDGWFWAAVIGLVVAALTAVMQVLFLFGDYFSGHYGPLYVMGDLATTSVISGLIAAIALIVVAVREVRQGIRRDWLHWTGLACWLGAVLLPLMTMIL